MISLTILAVALYAGQARAQAAVPDTGAAAAQSAPAAPADTSGAVPDTAKHPMLSLEEALQLARENSPTYRQAANDRAAADWQVRSAYGDLLPRASVSTGFQYQAAGTPQFGIFSGSQLGLGHTPAYYFSSYSLGLSYQLSGATLFGPSKAKSQRRAVDATTQAALATLENAVTKEYLAALQARDQVRLTKQQLDEAEENLKLAQAQVAVGSAIQLDATQAEVARGRAQVNLLEAENTLSAERLKLGAVIGRELPDDVVFTSDFQVFTPPWTEAELIGEALRKEPTLVADRASAAAAEVNTKAVKTSFLPSLSMSVGWSGFARQASTSADELIAGYREQAQNQMASCNLSNQIADLLPDPPPGSPADCSVYAPTPAGERAVVARNDVFPFHYTGQPLTASLRISLPIFTGFSRELEVAEAKGAEEDAREAVRARELQVRSTVAQAYNALVTAEKRVAIEEKNRKLSAEQLELAREQYRVGLSSFVDLEKAQTTEAQGEQQYLDALYSFHQALSDLEAAVGHPLMRPE